MSFSCRMTRAGISGVMAYREINFFGGDLFANSAVFAVQSSRIGGILDGRTAWTALLGKNTRAKN